ncbi:phage head closure protein [Cytobacillus sp. Sa5YUA1]|uniref:Phage head closure protein n=1 Tax=Cytobacillus stercorigallinarum TaxID=2762240 RepID=A0ABR8QNP0_9BACI|nr:phage head closure protein [Cytobacillus stercorigallinarum]MBD7937138.1 phage head closure protein [Cytobacillus stercorigallinarum]
MNPGKFDQKLLFQTSDGIDDDGFPTDSPSTFTIAWAELKTLRGKTFYSAAQSNMAHNRMFTIRYQKRLMDGFRPHNLIVVWRGIQHDIVSIENDDGQNATMTVVVKAVS